MSIEWREELATGIEAVDEQHKGIFARFAAFSTACEGSCAKEEILNLLDYLEEYTRDHFRDEEAALQEADYPGLAIQKENHAIFMREIAELKGRVGASGAEMPEILELKRLLIRWLIQHIRNLDMAYVDFLKGKVQN